MLYFNLQHRNLAIQYATDFLDRKDFNLAKLNLEPWLRANPNDLSAILLYARALFGNQEYNDALSVLENHYIIKPGPNDTQRLNANLLRAEIYTQLKQHNYAKSLYLNLLKTFPDDKIIKVKLVNSYLKLKLFTQAKTILEELSARHPFDLTIQLKLARTHEGLFDFQNAFLIYQAISQEYSLSEKYRYKQARCFIKNHIVQAQNIENHAPPQSFINMMELFFTKSDAKTNKIVASKLYATGLLARVFNISANSSLDAFEKLTDYFLINNLITNNQSMIVRFYTSNNNNNNNNNIQPTILDDISVQKQEPKPHMPIF